MENERSPGFCAGMASAERNYRSAFKAEEAAPGMIRILMTKEGATAILEAAAERAAERLAPDARAAGALMASDPWLLFVPAPSPSYGENDQPLWLRVQGAAAVGISRALAYLPAMSAATEFQDYCWADVMAAGGHAEKAMSDLAADFPGMARHRPSVDAAAALSAALSDGRPDLVEFALRDAADLLSRWRASRPENPTGPLVQNAAAAGLQACAWIRRMRDRAPHVIEEARAAQNPARPSPSGPA